MFLPYFEIKLIKVW